MPRKLAAGNWKMNGMAASLAEIDALVKAHPSPACEVLICPPATLIAQMAWKVGKNPIALGGQDCHSEASGAHTGDISAPMLADAGASYVIVGHSERRADHRETDVDVAAKARAAHAAGLTAVICVGETEAQRDAGETLAIIGAQLAGSLPESATPANSVVAYEPVWAIGTGRTPTLEQIGEVHGFLRAELAKRFEGTAADMRLLYGGSVKPSNAAEIFAVADVDGALVGGASLKADDFGPIVAALGAASA
ncbi:Triosephosphate isomerase [Defluviimonas aquaemixtae]|uniref:Triosephosphate isomerase n=1 Tax=Albidovulum aquaemixtae TaxID=1542388 RepID=A0A2R8B442_9RHOB|nr:triose-phosphate isomerase [Defluviimonas aquaemixtae]SPH17421.1 Triosephosphate isomerase [Defluviimonas aquaemixtae]